MPDEQREVVIAGAGPVGLSLALGLARRGRDVLVLEREPSTAAHSRAPAIWPATQEILSGLGVIDAFLREGLVVRRLQLWDADREAPLLALPLEELAAETRFPHLLILPQSRTERLLLDAVRREPTAEVRFGVEVTGFTPQASGVEVAVRRGSTGAGVRAAVLAGCDGAHSTVRHALGASFDGRTYGMQAALADVELDGDDHDLPFPRLTTTPRLAIGIRMTDHVWRLILPFGGGDRLTPAERIDAAVAALFATGHRTVWHSDFRLHRRISSTLARGRVVLAGDAAHVNSPVGGQGMNSGIRDAALLVAPILEMLDRPASRALEAYGDARRREIRTGVNRFTNGLTRLLLLGRGRAIRPMFRAASLALRVAPLRRRFLRRMAMLDGPAGGRRHG